MTIRRPLLNVAAVVLIAAGALTLPLTAPAQPESKGRYSADEIAKAKPTATFDLTSEQIRLIVGGGTASGTLHYQGKNYPFRAKGMSVGASVGITKATAAGDVYFLKSVEDFAGSYSAVGAGATLVGGVSASEYENEKGVLLKMRSKTEGVAINLGVGRLVLEFVK